MSDAFTSSKKPSGYRGVSEGGVVRVSSPGSEESFGVDAAVPAGAQFCWTRGFSALGWQSPAAPVDSKRMAWYVLAFLK